MCMVHGLVSGWTFSIFVCKLKHDSLNLFEYHLHLIVAFHFSKCLSYVKIYTLRDIYSKFPWTFEAGNLELQKNVKALPERVVPTAELTWK